MSQAGTEIADLGKPPVAAKFSGSRSELFGTLVAGYLLMLPTLGIYRFWVTTAKRRFYWKHTVVGGDPLEYTGTARQLLIGFLFALAVFLPIYVGFFYLSTQSSTVAVIGYGVTGALLWFLSGYAIYRGRDFRLSRTLWRGIRFDQKGSAMAYAVRRFLWSLLVLLTLGLAYPFMAGDLWRYRYSHTWFGDRQVNFSGSWKTIAGPFYKLFALLVACGAFGWVVGGAASSGGAAVAALLTSPVLALGFFYLRSREASRMFSAIRLGDAAVTVKLRARSLLGQFIVYSLALLATLLLLATIGVLLFVLLQANGVFGAGAVFTPARLAQSGWVGLATVVTGYLGFFASLTLMGEVFIDCGYWMLVARGATITGLESLASVRATGEDHSLVGEGLADALNVGSF